MSIQKIAHRVHGFISTNDIRFSGCHSSSNQLLFIVMLCHFGTKCAIIFHGLICRQSGGSISFRKYFFATTMYRIRYFVCIYIFRDNASNTIFGGNYRSNEIGNFRNESNETALLAISRTSDDNQNDDSK